MKHIHVDNVPWMEWSSPSGKFHGAGKQISEAMGAALNATIAQGGHPFDLEYGKLLPGKAGCPFHSHSAQWECYYILRGSGIMRHGDQRREVHAGDVMLHPPGSAHQLINTGDSELHYYLVADNPLSEIWHYPDSNKWGFKPGGAIFLRQDVNYHWGEDDTPETAVPPPPRPLPPEVPAHFVNIADLRWEHRRSPKGTFESHRANIFLALGGIADAGVQGGGHPFDLQLRRVAPGAAICPYHSHSTQWELFVFTAGQGFVRTPDGGMEVGPGDIVLHPPGQPHQTLAATDSELECLIIADNPPEDVCHYPDSGKWAVLSKRLYFRMQETGYFDGED